jgi:hypothetical protein
LKDSDEQLPVGRNLDKISNLLGREDGLKYKLFSVMGRTDRLV